MYILICKSRHTHLVLLSHIRNLDVTPFPAICGFSQFLSFFVRFDEFCLFRDLF